MLSSLNYNFFVQFDARNFITRTPTRLHYPAHWHAWVIIKREAVEDRLTIRISIVSPILTTGKCTSNVLVEQSNFSSRKMYCLEGTPANTT